MADSSQTALDQMSDAIAHATLTYAMTRSDIKGTGQASWTAEGVTEFSGHLRVR